MFFIIIITLNVIFFFLQFLMFILTSLIKLSVCLTLYPLKNDMIQTIEHRQKPFLAYSNLIIIQTGTR